MSREERARAARTIVAEAEKATTPKQDEIPASGAEAPASCSRSASSCKPLVRR